MRDWCKTSGYTVIMEYVEPGASATDDKRSVFQQMITEATLKPSPYDVVVVHSLSRFFRDSLEFGLYSVLAHAVEETKKHSLERVPSFVPNWLSDQGSNLGSADWRVF